MEFADRLKAIRKKKFPKENAFVDALNLLLAEHHLKGIKYNTYSTYEKGRREPRLAIVKYMAQALDTSTDNLLGKQTVGEHNELSQLVETAALEMGDSPRSNTDATSKIIASKLGHLYEVKFDSLNKIVQAANKLREEAIIKSVQKLLQKKSEKLEFDEDTPLGQVLLWQASITLNIGNFEKFKANIKHEQYSYFDFDGRLNLATALCYAYFTGINPTLKSSNAKDFTEYYMYRRSQLPVPEALDTDELKSQSHQILHEYMPKPRIQILEGYVTYVNNIDYMAFRKKFPTDYERFHRLQALFLDYLVKYSPNTLVHNSEEISLIRKGAKTNKLVVELPLSQIDPETGKEIEAAPMEFTIQKATADKDFAAYQDVYTETKKKEMACLQKRNEAIAHKAAAKPAPKKAKAKPVPTKPKAPSKSKKKRSTPIDR
jgi:transcriptional regulator with XRE-family HTH domain